VLREHQLVALILSLHDSLSSSKEKLAPLASFTRPHARKPPFSMGMITCPSLVARLLAQREGDVALAPAALIAAMAARAAISSVDVRRERPPLLDGPKRAQRTGGITPHHGADVAPQMADPVRRRLKGWGGRPSSFLGRPSGTPYFFRKYGARVHTAFSHWRYLTVFERSLNLRGWPANLRILSLALACMLLSRGSRVLAAGTQPLHPG
jgi:hypothetical protein